MMRGHSIRWLAGVAALLGVLFGAHATRAQQRVQVEFWHGLTMPLGGMLEKIVADFNESQTQYRINPTFKGAYPETMVAAIAAFRAGNAPTIVQMFEVGTATMMAARGAVKPAYELMAEASVPFDPAIYVPAVRGYYSLPDGRLAHLDAVRAIQRHPRCAPGHPGQRHGGARRRA